MSEDKTFTVTDRRLFTADGEARSAVQEPSGARPPEVVPEAVASGTASVPEGGDAPDEGEIPGPVPTTLGGLVLSLATQGSLLLGAAGQPPDLEAARSVITLVEVLQAKTEGNRTPEESRLVEGVLYELRMAYMAVSRSASR